jgi:hypothetical protein
MRGAIATVTVNAHEPVRPTASAVVQVTVDEPNTKMAPLCGEHFVLSGGSPAITCGAS